MRKFNNSVDLRRLIPSARAIVCLLLVLGIFPGIIIASAERNPSTLELSAEERVWLETYGAEISFAPTPYYPPLDFIDAEGEHRGYAGELLRLIEEKLGYRFERRIFNTWSDILSAAQRKEVDAVPIAHRTASREEYLAFTETYIEIPTVIIGRVDAGPVASLEELIGLEVAIGEGYALVELLNEGHPQLELIEVVSDYEALHKLSRGQFDAALVDFPVASYLIAQSEFVNLQMLGHTGFSYNYRMAVRKDWPEFVQILNKALASVSEEQLAQLENRWIPDLERTTKPYPWKIILAGFIVLILVLIFFLFWIWLLRRLVEKRTEELKESKRRLDTLIDNIPGGIVYRCQNEPGWSMEIIRGACQDVTGYSSQKIAEGAVSWGFDIIHPEDREKVNERITNALERRTQYFISHRVKTRSGENRWVTDRGQGVYDSSGKLLALEGFITDISYQKQVEEQLQESLREKETLLQEIHHRVKNNLFTIIAFLSLQQNKYSGEMSKCFQDAINRVQTMALIHKQIYDNENLSELNFSETVKKLCNNLIETYSLPEQNIRTKFDLDSVNITIDQAIPCALAATELISNAIYHGINGNQQGELAVELEETGPKIVSLTITDDGGGFPPDFELENTASLGLKLAKKLVENQLQGKLTAETTGDGKAVARIEFSLLKPKKNSGKFS